MGKSISKFIVNLAGPSAFKPQPIVSVSAVKDKENTYSLKIFHPNKEVEDPVTKEKVPNPKHILFEKEIVAQAKDPLTAFLEVQKIGKEMLLLPEYANIEAVYEERLFIAAPRKKQKKLKIQDPDMIMVEAELSDDLVDVDVESDLLEEKVPSSKATKLGQGLLKGLKEAVKIKEEKKNRKLDKKSKKDSKIKNKKKVIKKELKVKNKLNKNKKRAKKR